MKKYVKTPLYSAHMSSFVRKRGGKGRACYVAAATYVPAYLEELVVCGWSELEIMTSFGDMNSSLTGLWFTISMGCC